MVAEVQREIPGLGVIIVLAVKELGMRVNSILVSVSCGGPRSSGNSFRRLISCRIHRIGLIFTRMLSLVLGVGLFVVLPEGEAMLGRLYAHEIMTVVLPGRAWNLAGLSVAIR